MFFFQTFSKNNVYPFVIIHINYLDSLIDEQLKLNSKFLIIEYPEPKSHHLFQF